MQVAVLATQRWDAVVGAVAGPFSTRDFVLVKVEGLEGVEQKVTQVLLHVRLNDAPVAVVGHAAAVHDLAHEVPQRVPRDLRVTVLVRLGQVVFKQLDGDLKVRVIEVVVDVPTHLAVLAPLLHNSVEEGQDKDARPEGFVRAREEQFLWHLGVGGQHVELEAVGWLGHALDRALQDADRELRVGRRGEPQPELRVERVALPHALDNLVELAKPALHQVAVSEQHPVALDGAGVDEGDGKRRLALAEGDRLEWDLLLV
mmetsp:Transcript_36308/g.72230  ORF Transcript_36308/g.72230 Transcript_36308/m.72230 type:complete len:258 (+) Transcript_36308:1248-2021(+)